MSRDAVYGYAILASDRLGYSEKQETDLLHALYAVMDWTTPEEAEKFYKN